MGKDKKRQFLVKIGLLLFVLFGIIVSGYHYFGAVVQESKAAKVVRIGYLRVPNDELVAMEQGRLRQAFGEHGFQVTFLVFDSGVEANKALASGSIDFASMGVTNAVVALSQGLDVELIWLHELLGTNEALVVQPDSGIAQLADMKGKVIATTFASTSHYSLQRLLEAQGLTGQVTLLDMTTLDIAAAWKRGDIDGAYTWDPILTELKTSGGQVLQTSADLVNDGILTANVLIARKSFSHKFPEATAAFLTAIDQAATDYRKNPNQVAELAGHALSLSKETALTQMQGTIWLSAPEQVSSTYLGSAKEKGEFVQQIQSMAAFLQTSHHIKRLPTKEEIAAFLNTSYLEQVVNEGGGDE